MSYNRNIPAATDLISNSQSQIQGNFQTIDSGTTGTGVGFARNHVTMTDGTNGGLHERVDYYQAVSSPSISGFVSSAYPKTVTNVEFAYKNATQDMVITNSLLTASSGQGMMPGGLQIRAGAGNSGGSTTVSISFSPAFPTGVIAVIPVATGFDTAQSCLPSTPSVSGFTLTTSKTNLGYYWVAIGY